MTAVEFVSVMHYISLATGKELGEDRAEVYFDALGDIAIDDLRRAAKLIVCEHVWPTFASVAEIRKAVGEIATGVLLITPADAWDKAYDVIRNTDPEVIGDFERQCAKRKLPPLIREVIVKFGIPAFCYGDEPVGVLRGQFMKMFEQISDSRARLAMLPPIVREAIEGIGREPELHQALKGIGQMPEDNR